LETCFNEIYFKGINIFNNLQNKYFIDSIFSDISYVDINDFNKVFIFSSESEINLNDNLALNFLANEKKGEFLNSKYLKEISMLDKYDKDDKDSNDNNNNIEKNDLYKINFKEILLKILLNIIYNIEGNNEILNTESIRKFIAYYMDNDNEGILFTKYTIEFLSKIINSGFDKPKEEFLKDLEKLMMNLFKENDKKYNEENNNNDNNNDNDNENNNINTNIEQKDLLPLFFFQKLLNINFYEHINHNKNNFFDIYLKYIYNIAEKYLLKKEINLNFNLNNNNINEEELEYEKENLLFQNLIMINLLKEIRINIMLCEEEINISKINEIKELENHNQNQNQNLNHNQHQKEKEKEKEKEKYQEENLTNISNFVKMLFSIYSNIDKIKKNLNNKNNININNSNNNINNINSNNNIKEKNFENIFENFKKNLLKKYNINNNKDYDNINNNNNNDNNSDNNINFSQSQNKDFNKDYDKNKEFHKTISKNFEIFFSDIDFNYLLYIIPGNINNIKKKNEESYRKNISNTNFLSEFISKKDFVYKNMIYNIWSKINFDNFSDEYFEEKKIDLLKENLNFYIKEANKIFYLYLYKVELSKIQFGQNQIFNSNTNLNLNLNLQRNKSQIASSLFDNESNEFLFWKNLKILRINEEKKDKKKIENNNINIE
jgi:hypothetical protein